MCANPLVLGVNPRSWTGQGFLTKLVTGVVRQQCIDPLTGTFGSPITVDATGWAIGSAGGHLLVETHIPTASIGGAHSVRLGFTVSSGTLSDSMLQGGGGAAIIFTPDFAISGRHHAIWPASGRTNVPRPAANRNTVSR